MFDFGKAINGENTCSYKACYDNGSHRRICGERVSVSVIVESDDDRRVTDVITRADSYTKERRDGLVVNLHVLRNDDLVGGTEADRNYLEVDSVSSERAHLCAATSDRKSIMFDFGKAINGENTCSYKACYDNGSQHRICGERVSVSVIVESDDDGRVRAVITKADSYTKERRDGRVVNLHVLRNDDIVGGTESDRNYLKVDSVSPSRSSLCVAASDEKSIEFDFRRAVDGENTCSYKACYDNGSHGGRICGERVNVSVIVELRNTSPIEPGDKCTQGHREACCSQPTHNSWQDRANYCDQLGCNLRKCNNIERDDWDSSNDKDEMVDEEEMVGDVVEIEARDDIFDNVPLGYGDMFLEVLENDRLVGGTVMEIVAAEPLGGFPDDLCTPAHNGKDVKFDLAKALIGENKCRYKVCHSNNPLTPSDKVCDGAKIIVYTVEKEGASETQHGYTVEKESASKTQQGFEQQMMHY